MEQDRLEHVLFMLMNFDIHRYLMANTSGREDGAEKAQRHINLSYKYVASRMGLVDPDMAPLVETKISGDMVYRLIHDATQELTDYMDEVIDFPIDDPHPDYDELAPKFFKEFIRLADAEWEKIMAEEGVVLI